MHGTAFGDTFRAYTKQKQWDVTQSICTENGYDDLMNHIHCSVHAFTHLDCICSWL